MGEIDRMITFHTDVRKEGTGRLTVIELTFNPKEVFGISKGSIHVDGTINGVAYRSKLLSRGNGKYLLIVDKALQKSIGFTGQPMAVEVTMSLDELTLNTNSLKEVDTVTSDMNVIYAIKTRHSIRQFTDKPIPQEVLNTILQAGLEAPTAKNKRPYHFIVVTNRQMLTELAQNNSNVSMLEYAACGIVICGDKNMEGMKEFLYADCAAATQNMLLCLHGLGLGGVWCGVVANSSWRKEIISILRLPLKVEPISVIALGYSKEVKETTSRWEPDKIHYDRW